jgi:membrane-associated phospholipid phosphatase
LQASDSETKNNAHWTAQPAVRAWLLVLAVCVVALPLCVVYWDRSIAEFFNNHFRYTGAWAWLNRALLPFPLVVVAAMFFLFGAAGWRLTGREIQRSMETPLLCSWAAMWGLAAERIFKGIFGRPGPVLYFYMHRYEFEWVHANLRWDSFPSGTAILAMALAAVVWMRHPRLRVLAVALTVPLLCGVIVANWHWLSDVIAGAFLGVTIGWATVILLGPARVAKKL